MFRVLGSGGRTYADERLIRSHLALVQVIRPDLHLDHGMCPTGADEILDRCARELGISVKGHPADWDHCVPNCPTTPGHRRAKRPGDIHHPGLLADYCPGAGPRRNQAMVDLRPDFGLVYLTPGSRGARNCLRLIQAARIPHQWWTA